MSRALIASFVKEDQRNSFARTGAVADETKPVERRVTDQSAVQQQHVVLAYATYLGMYIVGDADLLWIAQQAVTADLPPGWQEHTDPTTGDSYCGFVLVAYCVLFFSTETLFHIFFRP